MVVNAYDFAIAIGIMNCCIKNWCQKLISTHKNRAVWVTFLYCCNFDSNFVFIHYYLLVLSFRHYDNFDFIYSIIFYLETFCLLFLFYLVMFWSFYVDLSVIEADTSRSRAFINEVIDAKKVLDNILLKKPQFDEKKKREK